MKINAARLILFSSILLIAVSLFLSGRVIFLAKLHQIYQIDLAEINSIRYGILNADEWEESIANIIAKKIEEFELTPENKQQLKKQVENILYLLLEEVDEILKEDMGRIKRFLMDAFVDLEELRKNVPELSEALLEEMEKPENKDNLTEYILQKLNSLVEETSNNDQQLKLNMLLEKYECETKELVSPQITQLSNQTFNKLSIDALLLISFLLITFSLNVFSKNRKTKNGVLIVLIAALIFLINGISIPMINIEAKISQLTFQLLGEPIIFENQVLFFQSKSILDVVWILFSTWKIDMMFVGILIFIFSILFPFTKLSCSYLILRFPGKFETVMWMNFFTFKSGKWSMADVFVVALFMAFIGFNGILGDQLSYLSQKNQYLEILTTNGTSLQIGFYLFLLFCLTGLFLSELIQNILKNKE